MLHVHYNLAVFSSVVWQGLWKCPNRHLWSSNILFPGCVIKPLVDKIGAYSISATWKKKNWRPLMPKTIKIAKAGCHFGNQLFWGTSRLVWLFCCLQEKYADLVVAYAVAEELNLAQLSRALQSQGLYTCSAMPIGRCVCGEGGVSMSACVCV